MSGPFSPSENLPPYIPEKEGRGLDLRPRFENLSFVTGSLLTRASSLPEPNKSKLEGFAINMHTVVCQELGKNGHPGDLEMEIGEKSSGSDKADEPIISAVIDALREGLHKQGAQIDLARQKRENINDIYMVTNIPDVYLKSSASSTPGISTPSAIRYSLVGHNKVPPEVRTALAKAIPIEPIIHWYSRFHIPSGQYEALLAEMIVKERTNSGQPSGLWGPNTKWRAKDEIEGKGFGSSNRARRLKDLTLTAANYHLIEKQLLSPKEYAQAVAWARKVSTIQNQARVKVKSELGELDARLSTQDDSRCITLLIGENEDMQEEYATLLIERGLRIIEEAKGPPSPELDAPDLLYSDNPDEVKHAVLTLRDIHAEIARSLTDMEVSSAELDTYALGLAKTADKWTEADKQSFVATLESLKILPTSPSSATES